jgi:hypothetical protein
MAVALATACSAEARLATAATGLDDNLVLGLVGGLLRLVFRRTARHRFLTASVSP